MVFADNDDDDHGDDDDDIVNDDNDDDDVDDNGSRLWELDWLGLRCCGGGSREPAGRREVRGGILQCIDTMHAIMHTILQCNTLIQTTRGGSEGALQ